MSSVHIMNDPGNITQFPRFNLNNIPEALRKAANDIENTPELCSHIILCGKREDGSVWYKAFGLNPFTKLEAVGMLEWAKFDVTGVLS